MKDKDKAKGMLLPVDCRQQVELLTDAEAGQLFKALLAYSGWEPSGKFSRNALM